MHKPIVKRLSPLMALTLLALGLGGHSLLPTPGMPAYGADDEQAAQDRKAQKTEQAEKDHKDKPQKAKAKNNAPPAKPAPKKLTGDPKTIYDIGVSIGQGLRQFNLTPAEMKLLIQGITDAVNDQAPAIDQKKHDAALLELIKKRAAASKKNAKAIGANLLKKEAAKPGAVKTKTGLIYFETKAGKGPSPTANDTVTVHYTLTLADGTIVDSSYDRGTPLTHQVSRLIPGWVEGLQKMKVGGKARLVIPADLGYGKKGVPNKIPPNAVLIADIELIGIGQ